MDPVHEDRFLVFLRVDAGATQPFSASGEQPLASCGSYEEARRIRQVLQGAVAGKCVIRYIGPTGGGD
jgi:hypothetical protein